MNKYMQIAKELSESNLETHAGGPFGAVVVKDGEIIGKGSNHVLANNDPTAHAEVMAIRDACKNINSYDLVSVTYNLVKNEVFLSNDINSPVNNVKKACEKATIPGAKYFISN